MRLYLIVQDGPSKGLKCPIRAGLKIGRAVVGMKLQDAKASAFHAEVEVSTDGKLFLVDKGSTNKIRYCGERVDRLELVVGAEFSIGSTTILVATEGKEAQPSIDQELKPKAAENAPPWRTLLVDFLRASPLRSSHRKSVIGAFVPALELEFIQGFQFGTVWTIGYGPRSFGKISLDLAIFEKDAPDHCFEIHPTESGPLFKTPFPDRVQLNNVSISSETLRDGDVISVANSKLRVRFL